MKKSIFDDISALVDVGYRGCFGIFRDPETKLLTLATERRWFTILDIVANFTDGSRVFDLGPESWEDETLLVLDGREKTEATRRLYISTSAGVLSSDLETVRGHLTLVAGMSAESIKCLGLEAVFGTEDGSQAASVLWDASPQLIHHWMLKIAAAKTW
ncbi:hypothetical protein KL86CLO1_11133 [uncultured Eubacteriales bacterium]|uniref:Uncharacterized protein n=1 Tax=uncultured Eubacteriales bacterium TaxID=172733 RepID=A0A212JII2_9FIRM|nr:hypothetical protein KL86CLO1_11133 [uncultured Eubacteriales bacterium]